MKEHNVRYDKKLFDAHTTREYITQKRETDYDFYARLAAEEGIVFWFECLKEKNEQCFFTDSRLGCTGGTNIKYNPHPQTAVTDNIINDLTFSVAMTPQKVIGKDRMYEKPSYGFEHEAENSTLKDVDPDYFAFFDSYARFPDDAMGSSIAKYRLQALQSESEVGDATRNCIEVMPGNLFTLSEHPDSMLNDRWQPITVIHHGTMPQALEEDNDGKAATMMNKIHFMSGHKHWHAPFRHKPLADGPEVAEVVGPPGEEIHTNEYGAVKVHFHWNRYDKADEKASCWVRISQSWNGHGYGFYAIPRIGQEVIVTYLDGDIDRPLVTGCVFNGNTNVPLDLPAAKTSTSFRSKTHKGEGFNELKFDDTNGQEGLSMHAQKDMSTSVRNDRSTQVDNNHSENIGNNQSIAVGTDQKETVGSNQTLSVGANQSIDVGANRTLPLIQSIALLHQYQREVKQAEHRGKVIDYIEVTKDDISLANRLAHEILGRTLDEMPPQTRKLLLSVQGWVKGECKRHKQKRSEYLLLYKQGLTYCYEVLYDGSDNSEQAHLCVGCW